VVLDDPNGDVMGFVVVVATDYPTALKAAKAVKVEWDLGPNTTVDSLVRQHAAEQEALTPANAGNWGLDGDADGVIAGSPQTPRDHPVPAVHRRYKTPPIRFIPSNENHRYP